MIKQKINLATSWVLSMRKRLSVTLILWINWCLQKVQHFHKFMKSGRINKVVKKIIPNEPKIKKTITKSTTTKKKNTTSTKQMPIKFKPSVKKHDRKTGQTTVEHYYIKNISKHNLNKELDSPHLKPKLRQKINNELIRRER